MIMIIFSFYTCISLYYVQGIKQYHKLCFSFADTTAKNRKNMKFAYRDTATSLLYKSKLPLIACQKSINSFF